MRSRPVVIAVMALMLLHQVVAGVFAGGTVLCISSAGGVALQPVGMTCCAVHGPQRTADPCCAEDAAKTGQNLVSTDCHGCTDHVVSMQPTLPPHAMDLALPPSTPVLIAVIAWPSPTMERAPSTAWHAPDRSPPPLHFLSTVVLRI